MKKNECPKNFYHYTSRVGIEGIMNSGTINLGRSPYAQINSGRAVCLTTDTSPVGHGLPDGRVITMNEANTLGHYSQINNVLHCLDFTKYRLKLSISDLDEKLFQASEVHSTAELIAMDVTAYFPTKIGRDLADEDFKSVLSDFEVGLKIRKSSTWWYYFSPIPRELICEVATLSAVGYLPLAPEEFFGYLNNDLKNRDR
jgi:hypothetical protein